MEFLAAAITNLVLLHGHIGYEYVPLWGNILLAIWFWCFGGNVGSFMNVVIYRLPAGASVVHPGSRCPKCLHAIRWRDNIPVLSWLILRARCRDCGMPIASRYPIVEAIVAIWFVTVAFAGPIYLAEHLGHDINVPLLRLPHQWWDPWLMYVNQALAICTLLCAALMRYDGHEPPGKLYVPAFVLGFVAPLFFPTLRLVPFHAPCSAPAWIGALFDSLAGLTVGVSLGLLAKWPILAIERKTVDSLVVPFALIGLVLGWQAVCVIACLTLGAHIVHCWMIRRGSWLSRLPASVHVISLSTIYIMFCVHIVDIAPWLGPAASIATFAAAATLVVPLALLMTRVQPDRRPQAEMRPDADKTKGVSDVTDAPQVNLQRILDSPNYLPAELDTDFLQRYELRPVRVQLELLKPEMGLAEHDVHSTIVAFGGTQIVEQAEAQARLERAQEALQSAPGDPQHQRSVQRAERILAKSKYYEAAREFARLVSSTCQIDGRCEYVISTGGGPGIMEAANRGAFDVGAKSIGLNITLPEEQVPNAYITPDLCFQFHYFALRKMHFLLRAKALVVFPGGFGTLDELFDALTLRQTQRMQDIPIILFGREYWEHVIDFQFLADEGVIADTHLDLIDFVETPQEAWDIISRFHDVPS